MTPIKRIVSLSLCWLCCIMLKAQNKYALIIGINDYYEVPGIKSAESLNGSVNDANAIRDLLISKFGFNAKNIDTIYNAAATRDNIIGGLNKNLARAKAGDIMLFYYSGHGVWMMNDEEKNDPIKRGMNQAMLTSDLYNYRYRFKCFLRDFTLKQYFNQFIDKKIMLTSIFDCCFSGNLAMLPGEGEIREVKARSVDFNDLMSRLAKNATEPMEKITGKNFSSPEEFNTAMQETLDKNDNAELQLNRQESARRSFNATEVIQLHEKDTIARPALRKNSRFLFLAATQDFQKALEFKDKTNTSHGLFTGSILRVFEKYPANTPMDVLFGKIKEDMATFKLKQDPTLYSDAERLKSNLVGKD